MASTDTAVAVIEQSPDLERYVAAIARRNVAWTRWQEARDTLDWAPSTPAIAAYNEAQHEYEWAARDLVKARVIFRAKIGTGAARCSWRTGYRAGDFGEVPIGCETTVGVRTYRDRSGIVRGHCAAHRDEVIGRWPAAAAMAVPA